jgi:opacity protein-like surface antigen
LQLRKASLHIVSQTFLQIVEGVSKRMKKTMLLCALLLPAAAGLAQESRQDVSISASGTFTPTIHGATTAFTSADPSLGALVSYRYLLTPRSGLEGNYGFTQNTPNFQVPGNIDYNIHTRQQEFSGAYVYTRTYKRYNPFLEAGVGAMFFSPIKDSGTTTLDLKRTTSIGALFGGGVAYELSPSFDIRAEYRGFAAKTPNYGNNDLTTNRYRVLSMPVIGIAYHF